MTKILEIERCLFGIALSKYASTSCQFLVLEGTTEGGFYCKLDPEFRDVDTSQKIPSWCRLKDKI